MIKLRVFGTPAARASGDLSTVANKGLRVPRITRIPHRRGFGNEHSKAYYEPRIECAGRDWDVNAVRYVEKSDASSVILETRSFVKDRDDTK